MTKCFSWQALRSRGLCESDFQSDFQCQTEIVRDEEMGRNDLKYEYIITQSCSYNLFANLFTGVSSQHLAKDLRNLFRIPIYMTSISLGPQGI